jgi:hypothetical protein
MEQRQMEAPAMELKHKTRDLFHGGTGSSQISGPRGRSEVGALLVSTYYATLVGRRETRPLGERRARPPYA